MGCTDSPSHRSATDINEIIAILGLKGTIDHMLSSSHFEHPIGLAFLMQSEETINIFHFRLCSLQISSVSYGQMLKCLTEIFIMLQISSVSSGHVADMRFGVAGGSVIIADENSILLCGWVVQDCSLQCSCTL